MGFNWGDHPRTYFPKKGLVVGFYPWGGPWGEINYFLGGVLTLGGRKKSLWALNFVGLFQNFSRVFGYKPRGPHIGEIFGGENFAPRIYVCLAQIASFQYFGTQNNFGPPSKGRGHLCPGFGNGSSIFNTYHGPQKA